jgi:hypothetical protein
MIFRVNIFIPNAFFFAIGLEPFTWVVYQAREQGDYHYSNQSKTVFGAKKI